MYSVALESTNSDLPVLFTSNTSSGNADITVCRAPSGVKYNPSTGNLSTQLVTAFGVSALGLSGYQVTTDTGTITTFTSDSSYIKNLSIDKMAGAGYASTTLTPTGGG